MQHAEFRQLFGANPQRAEPAVLAHRAACAECEKYARDLERVDALVAGALRAEPGPKPAPPPWELERQRAAPVRWFALAASVLVALALGTGVWWSGQDRSKLIAEVVKHADRERDVMIASEKRVSDAKVRRTLANGGATLVMDLPISIARTCKVRGYPAPHLVVQTSAGAVAVLLMQKQRFFLSHDFLEQGYEGTIVPKGGNSIAVLGTTKEAVAEGAKLVAGAIEWPAQPPEIVPAPAPAPAPQNAADKPATPPAEPPR